MPPHPAPVIDSDAFEQLAEPYRKELQLHCYRMLGSLHEAEDHVQEAFLRAWRSFDSFEGRGPFRAWLYSIATNVCLNALASRARARRLLPEMLDTSPNRTPYGEPDHDIEWLDPYPDSKLEGIADVMQGPEARYEMRESIELAFVAAIQLLPASQRAILLLRDVLGWSASDAAKLLDTSVTAINSRLQRARATLEKQFPAGRPAIQSALDDEQRLLLDRYVKAWEVSDLEGFVALLKEDAIYTMPPWREWFRGRDNIRSFFEMAWRTGDYGNFRLTTTSGNGRPAFAVYSRSRAGGDWHAHSIQLLTVTHGAIASLTGFKKPDLFGSFGLPVILSA